MGEDTSPESQAAEWFIALREEPDDADLRARFDAWRAADPRYAAAWADMDETARVISTAPPERRGYVLPSGVLPSAPRSNRLRAPFPHRPRRMRLQIAAVAAAACFALIAAPAVSLRFTADHISGVGEVRTISLSDGSTVQLGPESAIAFDDESTTRNVRLLRGQAMFDVARDPARPFRVAARDVTATVLGTAFEVRMIGNDTDVAVQHGRVRVDEHGASRGEHGASRGEHSASRELTAGDWVHVAKGVPTTAGTGNPDLVGAWHTGRVPIRNQPIAEAIAEMQPWYGGKIILTDAALGEKLVSGAYDFRDPVRSLTLIVAPYGGRVTRITPWLIVVAAPKKS